MPQRVRCAPCAQVEGVIDCGGDADPRTSITAQSVETSATEAMNASPENVSVATALASLKPPDMRRFSHAARRAIQAEKLREQGITFEDTDEDIKRA